MSLTRRAAVALAAAAALALTAASLLAVAFLGPPRGAGTAGTPACAPPELAGTTVKVTAADMGGRMMGAPAMRVGMRLSVDRSAVPHGQVSLAVVNLGALPHELLVLPLSAGQAPGSRPTGPDGRVDESGLLGEASATCAVGEGPGIAPGTASWLTLDLPAGDYELACNYPGHYAAGMHVRLTVT